MRTDDGKSKLPRNKIILSDDRIAKHWVKQIGKTKKEIAAAIEKVGDNPDTVKKELGLPARRRVRR